MRTTIIILLLGLFWIRLSSQTITNVVATQEGDKVEITYELSCDRTSDIAIYVSENGGESFKGPLQSVVGDVGKSISPGKKSITWNLLEDQQMLSGENIIFRVKGYSKFGVLIDQRDGKRYATVQIGNSVLLSENLAKQPADGKFWAYKNNPENIIKYGYLYDWETSQKICPAGWHLPNEDEYDTLKNFVIGNEESLGDKLFVGGASGFNVLLGGHRGVFSPEFSELGDQACFWTSSESYNHGGVPFIVYKNGAGKSNWMKEVGCSVRCFRDKANN
jgi:uncharacterized protein (TIGR02145 family)